MINEIGIIQYNNNILKYSVIRDDEIPYKINGESGSHIFYVAYLTNKILEDLNRNDKSGYSFTEEEIKFISMAASLHDIGKIKVPESILQAKRVLFPVEYDIVKHHSVFGEEIINSCTGEVDERVIYYAKKIARSHHERFDGTGYPDGLKGDKIPICAQVVSIADVYDALTSERSYKKNISKDVAIEMIVNGMSGVFNETLIKSLLRVIKEKEFLMISDEIKNSGKVSTKTDYFTPSNVLIIGNTEYITKDFLHEAFYDSTVLIAGKSSLHENNKLKIRSVDNSSIDMILKSYRFDLIIYLSHDLTYMNDNDCDAEILNSVLDSTNKYQESAKVIYISSLEASFAERTAKTVIVEAKENLCEFYFNKHSMDIKIIRIPYLYSGIATNDILYKLFKARGLKSFFIQEAKNNKAFFISTKDLGELIRRIYDNWNSGTGILTINDEFNISFGNIVEEVKKYKKIDVEFNTLKYEEELHWTNKALRSSYGWFPKVSIIDEIKSEYDRFLNSDKNIAETLGDKLKIFSKEHNKAFKNIELIILFLVTEILVQITQSSIYFSIVDFRMAFIVIIATLYGFNYGLASATLASFAWFLSKMISGSSALTIFYEPTNWLSFILYFIIGALCGYKSLKNKDDIDFVNDENKILEEKLDFTKKLYVDTFNEKRDLKKQIISSKDSFGKIFEVIQKLDKVELRELYLKIIETFELILDNKTISIYSVNHDSSFARLEAASRDIIDSARRSFDFKDISSFIEILNAGELWKNTEFIDDMPMYAKGIFQKDQLKLIITIRDVNPNQLSLYYSNLFTMLCNLAQMSLIRAYDYSMSIYDEVYIEDTSIYKPEYFEKELTQFRALRDKNMSSFLLVEIDEQGQSIEDAASKIYKCTRKNDIIGLSNEGHLMLLLSQARESDFKFVARRFENSSLKLKIVEGI